MKKTLMLVIIYFLVIFTSFSPTTEKDDPLRHIDRSKSFHSQKLEQIENQYKAYAQERGIKFTNEVPMWFTDIKVGEVVGLCTYGKNYRIIDIDTEYFKKSTDTTQKTLVFHELTHCLCSRGHDYGEDKNYLDAKTEKILNSLGLYSVPFFKPRPGFYPDDCPLSIMYPIVVDDDCIAQHEKDYINEMFDRCKPY